MRTRITTTLAVLAATLSVLLFPQVSIIASSPAWTSVPALPAATGNGASVAAPCEGDTGSQCAYSIGGSTESANGLDTVLMFDAASDNWTSVAPLSTGRAQLAAASGPCLTSSSETCIYAIGGADSGGTFLNSVEVYSPYANTWSSGPTLPTPYAPPNFLGRAQLTAASGPCFNALSETCVYAVGGYNPSLYQLSSVEMLNPATGTWTPAASLNVARSRSAAASAPCEGDATQTCLYVVGGTGTDGFLGSVEMFDPSGNGWTEVAGLHVNGSTTNLEVAGEAAASAPCLGNASSVCLYAFGGQDENYNILSAAMMFDPSADSWSYGPAMVTPRDNFAGATAPCPQEAADSCLFAPGGSGANFVQAAEVLDLSHTNQLVITANNATATYGGQMPAFTFQSSGFVNGDTVSSLATQPVCSSSADQSESGEDTSPAGQYPITCGGAVDPNYAFTYRPGTLTVGVAPLSVTASSPSMTYGQPVPSIAPIYAGLVNGDSAPQTPPSCGATANDGSGVGAYPTSCTGASDANYSISYHAGSMSVGPAPLTITPVSVSVGYGKKLSQLAWTADFVGGDSAASLTKQPGCATTVKTTPTGAVSSPAGTYPITCGGAVDPNYSISFASGRVQVTLATLAISYIGASSFTNGNKATLSAHLSESGSGVVAGRRVTITLGSGTSAQSCATGASNSSGKASCSIAKVKQAAGKVNVTVAFAGDSPGPRYDFAPATKTVSVTVKK